MVELGSPSPAVNLMLMTGRRFAADRPQQPRDGDDVASRNRYLVVGHLHSLPDRRPGTARARSEDMVSAVELSIVALHSGIERARDAHEVRNVVVRSSRNDQFALRPMDRRSTRQWKIGCSATSPPRNESVPALVR